MNSSSKDFAPIRADYAFERNLTFRDRLRRNAEDRDRYEKTKRELATHDWSDMNAYANAKTEVIENIIAAAQTEGEITR